MEIIILLTIVVLVILIFLFARIASKAGYSKWWALPMVIPLIGVIMVWVFAFAKWPIEEKQ